MKFAWIALLFIVMSPLASAEDAKVPDGAQLLNDLTAANKDKDATVIAALVPKIAEYAKASKETKIIDGLAKELTSSYKVCKGNWGTLRSILDALGTLRSGKGESLLKKAAFMKDAESEDEISIQVHGLLAIGQLAEKKYVDKIIDASKNRETKIAIAAYETLKNYGVAKGKVRKEVAENLMKRIEAEYPYTTNANSTNPGEAAIKRWGEVQKPIIAALQSVCHETTIADLDNWREWWKENKKNAKRWKDKKA